MDTNHIPTERDIANAIVGVVCRCTPGRHTVGYPHCSTARQAARTVLALFSQQPSGEDRLVEFSRQVTAAEQARDGDSNDAEIDALWDVARTACDILGVVPATAAT